MARKKRKVPAMNATSSADIAFMLLIFFLITTSMDTDMGLARRLPPPVPKDQKDQSDDINKRNLLVVLVNSNNEILCNGELIDIKQLKEKAKEFIDNPANDPHMPEKKEIDVPLFGKQMVTTQHVISVQNDVDTQYQAYLEVQNELVAAYNELRNEYAMKRFGKTYSELDEDTQKAIQKLYPQKISEAEPKNYGGNK